MITVKKYAFRNVIAVEDSELDQFIIKTTMKKTSFAEKLNLFNDGKSALNYFEQLKATDNNLPQLIVLDIHMPEMDGFEFLTALYNLYSGNNFNIPVIFLTSSTDAVDKSRSTLFPNVNLYLNKPLNIEKLEKIRATVMPN